MSRREHLSMVNDNPEEPPKTPWASLILTTVVLSTFTTVTGLIVSSVWSRGARARERKQLEQDQKAIHYLVGRDLERTDAARQIPQAPPPPPPAPSVMAGGVRDLPHPMSGEYGGTYDRQFDQQRDAQMQQQRMLDEIGRRMVENQRKLDAHLRKIDERIASVEENLTEEDEDEDEEEEEEEEEAKPRGRRR